MIPVDTEARIYFVLAFILAATVVFLLVVTFSALRAADRADRRTRRAEAAVLGLSERLKARDRALEHWKLAYPSRLDDALAMRVVPLPPEPAQRPGLADATGDIT